MAKSTSPTPPPVEAITPVHLGADAPTPPAPPPPAADELEALRAKLARAEAERDSARKEADYARGAADRLNAELQSAKAPAGPVFAPGRRYLVTLKDAPSWVVEPEAGEHPWEAYRRATGVISSAHAPSITETDAPAGKAV